MSARVLYEIARHQSCGDGQTGALLDRVQLVADGDALRLRDFDGNETSCEATDIAAVIGSAPALCEIRGGQDARIMCGTISFPSCRCC